VNATGGSSSVKDAWEHLRTAAATAKASLLMSAADQWKVPLQELKVTEGMVSHASGKSAHFGELAKGAAGQTPKNVALKDRKDWALIGKPAARADVPAKTNGTAVFGIDVRLPNMLFASVVQAPPMGGTLSSFDAKEALAMPGVVKCVQLNSANGSAPGFAVVAKTTWHAKQAAEKVKAQWAQRAEGAIDTKRIEAELKEKLKSEKGFAFYEKGDAAKALKYFNQFINFNDKFGEAYQARAKAHQNLGQTADAIQDLKRSFQLQQFPHPGLFIEASNLIYSNKTSNLLTALDLLDEGIKRLGVQGQLQEHAIKLLLENNRSAFAAERMLLLGSERNHNVFWRFDYAQLLVKTGRKSDAQLELKRALRESKGIENAAVTDLRLKISQQLSQLN
jgi:tetratricopeptide (TPR) repeat protein